MDYRIVTRRPDGQYGYLPHYKRMTSEYLTTALALGLQVRHCEELRHPWQDPSEAPPPRRDSPGLPPNIWTLRAWCPAAYRAAYNGSPLLIFWHFQRASQYRGGLEP